MMKTFTVLNDQDERTPIFQIENAYISPATVAQILKKLDGVTDLRLRKLFDKYCDVHVEFKFMGQRYIVWEPFGDNSRYWIGPADMVEGYDDVPDTQDPADLLRLEDAFKGYRPPFHRMLFGNVVTLRFITRFVE